jgi:hypothetical protein
MRQRLLIVISLLLTSGVVARAADEARPATLGEAKAKEQVQSLAEVATLPILTADRPSDVIQIGIRDNFLLVQTKLKPTEQAVVRAPGLPGLSRVRITRDPGVDPILPVVETFNLDNVDYSVPGVVSVHTGVAQSPGKLMITQDHDRMDDQVHSVQLVQTTGDIGEGDSPVMLYVQITASPEVNKKLPAKDIVDLRRKYPNETSTYLDPIFRTLRMNGFLLRVDPRLAWQVFADGFVPPAQLQSDLKRVLAALDADDFQAREAASRELEKLGQPAALALMKVDRNSLTDEQRGRVDAFVAQFKTVPPEKAEEYRRSRDFLLDCLFAEDEQIRARALEQLRKVTGRPIEFDVTADADHRLAAIEKLRAEVGAPEVGAPPPPAE